METWPGVLLLSQQRISVGLASIFISGLNEYDYFFYMTMKWKLYSSLFS